MSTSTAAGFASGPAANTRRRTAAAAAAVAANGTHRLKVEEGERRTPSSPLEADDNYSSDNTNNTTTSSGLSTPTSGATETGIPVDEDSLDLANGGTIADDTQRARSRTRSPSFKLSRKSPTPAFNVVIQPLTSPSLMTNAHKGGFLELPAGAVNGINGGLQGWGGSWSRSPSPLGLIPIHRTFSSLIHKHEVPRKLLHCSIGVVVVYLYRNGYQPAGIVPWLAGALVPVASADLLRLNWDSFNKLYIRALGALMRESEVRGTNGVVWYLVGTLTVLAIFPKDVATLSILLLSWCDTAASTFGRAWGRYTPKIRKGKSVAGSLASFIVGAITAWAFWGLVVPSTPKWPDDPVNAVMWNNRLRLPESVGNATIAGGLALGLASLWTGFVASASEVMDLFGLDDNVVIPVISAAGIWGFLKVFG